VRVLYSGRRLVKRAFKKCSYRWSGLWVNGKNQMPRTHVNCIPGAKCTEQRV